MPNELSFNTAKAWEDIYGHRVGLQNMDKDPIHVGAIEAIPGATNLTMAPDTHHARQRRALAHAFSKQALLEQEPILKEYVNLFVTKLRELSHRGEAANMVSWYNFCTFDIIGDLSFGEPFGCLNEGKSILSVHENDNLMTFRRGQRICKLGRPHLRINQGGSSRASNQTLRNTRILGAEISTMVRPISNSGTESETSQEFDREDRPEDEHQD